MPQYQSGYPQSGYPHGGSYAGAPGLGQGNGQDVELQLITMILKYLLEQRRGVPGQYAGQQPGWSSPGPVNAGGQPQDGYTYTPGMPTPRGGPSGDPRYQYASHSPQSWSPQGNQGYGFQQPQSYGQDYRGGANQSYWPPQGPGGAAPQSFGPAEPATGCDVEVFAQRTSNDRTQGYIQIRDPQTGQIIFRSPVVNGGSNGGMVPPGRYELTSFEGNHRFGPVFRVTGQGGRNAGQVYDPRLGRMRDGILIHRQFGQNTSGCFGVQDNEGFMRAALWLQQRTGRRLTMSYQVA